jgi:hypothetical protein
MNFKVHLTNHGLPAFWESGGREETEGYAEIVTDLYFKPKKVINRPNRPESNGETGLFILNLQDHIISANQEDGEWTFNVYQVTQLDHHNPIIGTKHIASFEHGEWDENLIAGKAAVAIIAVTEKATCLNCTHVHYEGKFSK